MDADKRIQQCPSVRRKTMSELIVEKHKKNQQELNSLREKWMTQSNSNKKLPEL